MTDINLINNLWVILAALFVFIMTVAVGLLEVGELGSVISNSLLKTLLISGIALFILAFRRTQHSIRPHYNWNNRKSSL